MVNQNDIVTIDVDNHHFNPDRGSNLGRVTVVDGDGYQVRTLDLSVYRLAVGEISPVTDAEVVAAFEAAEQARLTMADRTKIKPPQEPVEAWIDEMRGHIETQLLTNEGVRPILVLLDYIEPEVKQLLDEQAAHSRRAVSID